MICVLILLLGLHSSYASNPCNESTSWRVVTSTTKSGWAWDVKQLDFVDADGVVVTLGDDCFAIHSGSVNAGYEPENAFNNNHGLWGGRKTAGELFFFLGFECTRNRSVQTVQIIQSGGLEGDADHATGNLSVQLLEGSKWMTVHRTKLQKVDLMETIRIACGIEACTNSNNGATDVGEDDCTFYDSYPSDCSEDYDDHDFRSLEMCCSCGGGNNGKEVINYVLGQLGQDLCPSGSQRVTNEKECSSTAAAALGKSFKDAFCYDGIMTSVGCFVCYEGKFVCFSTCASFATQYNHAPVCKHQVQAIHKDEDGAIIIIVAACAGIICLGSVVCALVLISREARRRKARKANSTADSSGVAPDHIGNDHNQNHAASQDPPIGWEALPAPIGWEALSANWGFLGRNDSKYSPGKRVALTEYLSKPENWTISWQGLERIESMAEKFYGDSYEEKTMYNVVDDLVKGACAHYGAPIALVVNDWEVKPCDDFVTHCWSELFWEFMRSLRSVYASAYVKPNLFICAFTIFQGSMDDIKGALGERIQDAAFVRTLATAKRFIVVRNSRADLYERGWCLIEFIYAKKFGLFPQHTNICGPDEFANSLISVLDMKCFDEEDRLKLITAVLDEGSAEDMDDEVHNIRVFSHGRTPTAENTKPEPRFSFSGFRKAPN